MTSHAQVTRARAPRVNDGYSHGRTTPEDSCRAAVDHRGKVCIPGQWQQLHYGSITWCRLQASAGLLLADEEM